MQRKNTKSVGVHIKLINTGLRLMYDTFDNVTSFGMFLLIAAVISSCTLPPFWDSIGRLIIVILTHQCKNSLDYLHHVC